MNHQIESAKKFSSKTIRSTIVMTCAALLMCGLPADGAQTSKKKIAEEAIGSLDFNMGCFRIEKELVPSFEFKVKHFMWKRLVECKSNGDTLGFLNAADDIVNGRSDKTTAYKTIPDGNTIRSVCAALKNVRLRCEFLSKGKKLVVFKEDVSWRRFAACCRSGDIRLDTGAGKVLYRRDKDYAPFVPVGFLSEVKAGEKFAVFGNELVYIGEKGSIDKYAQNDFRKNVEDLCKQFADQEISLSEFKAKLMKMDDTIRDMLKRGLTTISNNARAEQKVQTKTDFEKKVLPVSFCVGDHIIVQEGLVPYIHTAKVDESLLKLRRLQQAREWEKMVEQLIPDANLENPNIYDEAWKALSEKSFRVKIVYSRSIYCFARYVKSISSGDEENGESEVYVNVIGKEPIYVYASENGKDPIEKLINRSGFDVEKWMKTHKVADASGRAFRVIERTGFRDRSLLLERRPKNEEDCVKPLPKNYEFSLENVLADNAHFHLQKYLNVCDAIPSPKCSFITNIVIGTDSRGKQTKTIERRTVRNLPLEIKRQEKIFSHPDFVDVYRKYGGEEDPMKIKEDWKQAREHIGDPEPLRDDIVRRFKESFRDSLSKEELKERYEVYDRRAKGQDFRSEQFRKWAVEDQSLIVYEKYVNLCRALNRHLIDIEKQMRGKLGPIKRK